MGQSELRPFLEDLEARLVPAVEEELLAAWREFLAGRCPEPIFSPRRRQPAPPGIDWPTISVNQALGNGDAMALQQLRGVSDALSGATGGLLCVRCNYGVGILPSLFGARLFMMTEEQNCLPNVWPLDGGREAVSAVLDRGVPDLHTSLGGHVFAMGRYFLELFAPYPGLRRYVAIYHPYLQGPLDVTELLWGSGIFTDLLDEADRVHAMLDLVVRTYTAFLTEWYRLVPPTEGEAVHWSMLHRGRIMLRDDSAMNLSPTMIREFVAPYDQRLLTAFGGGCIHYCGRGDYHVPILAHLEGLYGINLSQPELNQMEIVFRHTVDRGVPLLGLQRAAAEAALAAGRDLHHRVHCW